MFKERYQKIIIDLEEFKSSDYYKKLDPDLQKYTEKALTNNCYIGIKSGSIIDVAVETKDKSGDPLMFHQSLYNDPTNNTFMEIYLKDGLTQGNRTDLCTGINIWEIDKLVEASYRCGKCKQKIYDKDDFVRVLYAALECAECAEKSWEYINSKPSGYWTS